MPHCTEIRNKMLGLWVVLMKLNVFSVSHIDVQKLCEDLIPCIFLYLCSYVSINLKFFFFSNSNFGILSLAYHQNYSTFSAKIGSKSYISSLCFLGINSLTLSLSLPSLPPSISLSLTRVYTKHFSHK